VAPVAACPTAAYNGFVPRKRTPTRPRLHKAAQARLPTRYGLFRILGLRAAGGRELVVLVKGKLNSKRAPILRIHSQCLTGDVFASSRCDCRAQLELAMEMISRRSGGIVIYEPDEGRGIGLINKLRAYELQDNGLDTVEANRHLGFAADQRHYGLAASALKLLGVTRVRLLSNNPDKVRALEAAGIRVVERIPCQPSPSRGTRAYLKAKKDKMGHLLVL